MTRIRISTWLTTGLIAAAISVTGILTATAAANPAQSVSHGQSGSHGQPANPGQAAAPDQPAAPEHQSGTAVAHGKEIVVLECAGLGKVTVSVPRNEHNNAAGQLVGQKGHGIPVTLTTTITDATTKAVLFTETRNSGKGHGHPHQATTLCKSTFEALASEFFGGPGEELPPGVSPTDLIQGVFEALVIVKK
jgi:hypothetical protein